MSQEAETTSTEFGRFRLVTITIWAAVIISTLAVYFSGPAKFSPRQIAEHINEFETAALGIYLMISIFRGLTLLPSTPLILAGTFLFPNQPWLVLAISLLGIVVSSGMIFYLSSFLGIAAYFERRKPHHVSKIRSRLEHPAGLFFVAIWAFFPLVPTDAVCYVAGTMRVNFLKFIAAVFIGEFILCSAYVFGGSGLLKSYG